MPKKILIVDDELDIRNYLETLFKNEGYVTATATDGVEGLKALESEAPDLITLDLQMPNNTGTDFYRKMHRNEKFGNIPVIVISGVPGRHLAVKKPAAVFDKPIDRDKLMAAVKEAIG
ncbi:MAG: response regulator [candidate division Zixibacteria bacterium]|nr:response regulator [candidate division Zixibacteria bacterium]